MHQVIHVIHRIQYNEYFKKAKELGGYLIDQPFPMADYDFPGSTRIAFEFPDTEKGDKYYEWGIKNNKHK